VSEEYQLPNVHEMRILGGDKPTTAQLISIARGEKPKLTPGQILLSKNQYAAWQMLSRPGIRYHGLYGGTRCVAGDTLLDGHSKTIAELAEIGEPVQVLTSRGVEMAEAPFKKGFAKLITFRTASGRSITVTPDHRFFTGERWAPASSFRVGDLVAISVSPLSAPSRPESTSEHTPRGSLEDGRHLTRTVQGSPGRCSGHLHLCGELLLRGLASFRAYRASPCGVLGHNPHIQIPHELDIHKGRPDPLGQEYTRFGHGLFRFSRRGGFPFFGNPSKALFFGVCNAFEWFLALRRTCPQAPLRTSLPTLGKLARNSSLAQFFFVRLLRDREFQFRPFLKRDVARSSLFQTFLRFLEEGFCSEIQPESHRGAHLFSTHIPNDSPLVGGYALDTISSISGGSYAPFYTLHVPKSQQYFANGFLNHNSGKTFQIVRAIVTRAIKAKGTNHAMLRYRGNAARTTLALGTLPSVMRVCYPEVQVEERRQDGYFELPNGSKIWIGGLDDKDRIEKILGTEYSTIFLNEASQIPYQSFVVAMTRLAEVHESIQQRAYIDLNPVGKSHWTNKIFHLGIDPTSNTAIKNPEVYAYAQLNPVDNAHNLSKDFLDNLSYMPLLQRKRFFEGVYVDEVEGALWTYDTLDRNRVDEDEIPISERQRVVVAVDPSGAKSATDEKADEIGIIVAAKGRNGHGYVLADASLRASPREWALAAVRCYHQYQADCIVAETNYGGAMVEDTIRMVDPNVNFKSVTASRGKTVRAEPIAALYDSNKVHHVGRFPKLEDQMCAFSAAGYAAADSPDHADALVWAISELFSTNDGTGIIEFYRRLTEDMLSRKDLDA
jgi:hypothetical protein